MILRFALVGILVLAPSFAHGQTGDDPRVWLRSSHKTSSLVRITTRAPTSFQGVISSTSDSTVVVNSTQVHVDSISMIEVGELAGGSGTIIGAVIGGVLGVALMGLASLDSPCNTCTLGAIALSGAGALIGSAASRHTAWKVVWTRP